MPQPRSKKARKEMLAAPKAEQIDGPLQHHRYSGLRHIAHQAVGLVKYEAVCPNSLHAAQASTPYGATSIEYGDPSAVYGQRGEGRTRFDQDRTESAIAAAASAAGVSFLEGAWMLIQQELQGRVAKQTDPLKAAILQTPVGATN